MSRGLPLHALPHLFPVATSVNPHLLEQMWERLDRALADSRLEVRTEDFGFGPIHVVTALGLLQVCVDHRACEIWGGVIVDGSHRRIGWGLPAFQLLWMRHCPCWWLRFAFQVWAPERPTFDYVHCPLQRPDNIELDTSRALVDRLGVDPRFRTLPEEFDVAIGLPTLMQVLTEDDPGKVATMEWATRIWQSVECGIAIGAASRTRRDS